jgi:hypothetical protein
MAPMNVATKSLPNVPDASGAFALNGATGAPLTVLL